MANEKLRIDIEARDRASKTVNNVSKSMGNMSKSTRQGANALAQVARGVDDLQYGMQGLRNNLIEVGLSFGGLKGAAISAALVGIGYFIESLLKTDKKSIETKNHLDNLATSFSGIATQAYVLANIGGSGGGIDKMLDQVNEALSKQEGTVGNVAAAYEDYQNALDKASKSEDKDGKLAIFVAESKLKLLKETEKFVKKSTNSRIAALDKELKKQNQLAKSEDDDDREKAKKRAKELEEQRAELLEKQFNALQNIRQAERGLNKARVDSAKKIAAANKPKGSGSEAKPYEERLFEAKKAIASYKGPLSGLIKLRIEENNVLKEGAKTDREKQDLTLKGIQLQTQLTNAINSETEATKRSTEATKAKAEADAARQQALTKMENFQKLQENMQMFVIEYDEMFTKIKGISVNISQVIAGALSTAAQAIGSGKDVGKALLGYIGNVMVQLGTMLVTIGAGIEAFKVSLQTLNPFVAIAGGLALIALGSAFASAANKAGGGGGSSSIKSSGSASGKGVARPTVTDAGTTVAVAKVKGQDLILALENANYSRQGYYGG